MTKDQQAELEQVARDFMNRHRLLGFEGCLDAIPDSVRELTELLAAQRVAGLEAAAEHWTQVGVKRAELYDALASKAMIEMGKIRNEETANFVAWLYKQANEQRP